MFLIEFLLCYEVLAHIVWLKTVPEYFLQSGIAGKKVILDCSRHAERIVWEVRAAADQPTIS